MTGVCAFSGQANAVIPLVSGFHIGGRADANDQDGSFTEVVFHQDQTGTLNSLGGSIRADDFDLMNPGHSRAVTSEGSATWADSAHGTVIWRNMGWERNTIATSAATLNKFVSGPVWYYIFEATFDGILTLDYDVRVTGDPFALAGLTIGWDGPGGGLALSTLTTPPRNAPSPDPSPQARNTSSAWITKPTSFPQPASSHPLGKWMRTSLGASNPFPNPPPSHSSRWLARVWRDGGVKLA